MTIKRKIIAASLGFGLLFWIIDALISYSILYEGTLLGLLATQVPKTALYVRLTVLGFFIIFGVIMSDLIAKSREAAEELRDSEEKFRSIGSSAKDAIIMVDNKGYITFWNEAAEIIFRYRRQEVLGRELKFLIPEKYHELFDKGFERFKTTGYAPLIGKTIEISGIKKGGDEIPLEISFSSVKLKHKWNAIGIVRDISQRKKAENELKIKDLAVDSTINAIALIEPKGKLTYVNPAFRKMWRLEENESLGQHFVEFWNDEHKALDVLDALRERGSFMGEMTAKRKDDTVFNAQISASMVKNDVGQSLSMIASFIDITARKLVEKKLEIRSEFEKLVTAISTNFINLPSDKIDKEISTALQVIGEFADVDRSYVYLYNPDKTKMSMTHEWCTTLVTPLFQIHQKLSLNNFKWQNKKIENRETLYINDLEEIPSSAGAFKKRLESQGVKSLIQVPVAYGGEVFGFLGLESQKGEKTWSVDIVVLLRMVGDIFANALERKRVEEQLNASLREKEVLLKEIHHRVKNNMQVISSLLNLQSGRIKNREILDMFKESQDRIRSMSLIHERLYQSGDLAKIDFSQYIQNLADHLFQSYRISPDAVSLETTVSNISLNINLAIPCGLIINELVSNSLKYAFPQIKEKGQKKAPKGKIRISLTSDDGTVTLLVQDNGIGLSEELDIENTDSFGLQLVSALVGQLHGSIEIKRKPGATFTIRFAQSNKRRS